MSSQKLLDDYLASVDHLERVVRQHHERTERMAANRTRLFVIAAVFAGPWLLVWWLT